VKITAQDLQRQYREMSDDELLSLNPDELMDLARQCYQQEMARRSLVIPGPDESPEPDGSGEGPAEDLVEVATFISVNAAKMAQSALESAGIPCVLLNEHAPRWTGQIDGPRLMVPASSKVEAREALGSLGQIATEAFERWLREALPGRAIMIEDMLAEDDLVAARLTIDGAHQAFCFARIAGGTVAETWHNLDQLGAK